MTLVAFFYPEYRYLAVYTMIIEVNTWLLILRRCLPHRVPVVEALFLSTWVLIRLIWFPYLAIKFFHLELYTTAVGQVGLCIFQLKWSLALFRSYFPSLKKHSGRKINHPTSEGL